MHFSPVRSILQKVKLRLRSQRQRQAERELASTAPASLVRPPGGFGPFYDRVVRRMRSEGVDFRFGIKIDSIVRGNDADFRLTSFEESFQSKRIISTWPLQQVSEAVGLPAPNLRPVALYTLMVAYTGTLPPNAEVLFNFHPNGLWKRITMMSRLYGQSNGREYFSVECPSTEAAVSDPVELFEAFVTHVKGLNLFPGELRLMGIRRTENAYPIMPIGFEKDRDDAVERLRAFGIEPMGRHGKFEYIPHSTLAVQLAKTQLKDTPAHRTALQNAGDRVWAQQAQRHT